MISGCSKIRLAGLGGDYTDDSPADTTVSLWSSERVGDPKAAVQKHFTKEIERLWVSSENGSQPCIRDRKGKSGYGIGPGSKAMSAWGGCSGTFGISFKSDPEPVDNSQNIYIDAERDILNFIDKIRAGTIKHDAALIPLSLKSLRVPDVDAKPETKDAYESYLYALNSELPDARNIALQIAEGSSATSGSGSAIVTYEEGVDTYQGGEVYSTDGGVTGPYTPGFSPSGNIIANPYAPAPVEEGGSWNRMSNAEKATVGVGGALLLGGIAWVMMRRRKRSRKRRR